MDQRLSFTQTPDHNYPRSPISLCALAAWWWILFLVAPASSRVISIQNDTLERGTSIERELKSGQADSYRTTLVAGQYLHLIVEQRGIDVVVRLVGPDGARQMEKDSPNGSFGPELVFFLADVSGEYRVDVQALESEAPPGRYELKVEALAIRCAGKISRRAATIPRN
jgi:hypothetical protein